MDSKQLYAGWARQDLTPDRPVRLYGQFIERISESVESPVLATALAIECGLDQMILCACDLADITHDLADAVRQTIQERLPEFPVTKLILAATHTHTSLQYDRPDPAAGNTLDILQHYLVQMVTSNQDEASDAAQPNEAEPAKAGNFTESNHDVMSDQEARLWLIDRISRASTDAWQNRRPARMVNAFGRAVVGHCRRVVYDDGSSRMWGDTSLANFAELEGGSDSGLELLYFCDDSGQLTGVVANLACPAQTVQHRRFISADFWGKARLLVQKQLGTTIHLLPLCSAAGDQCPVDLIRWVEPLEPLDDPNITRHDPPERTADYSMFDLSGCWQAGWRIASEIIAAWQRIDAADWQSEPDFKHWVCDLSLPVRRVSLVDYAKAKKALSDFARDAAGRQLDFHDNAQMHVHAGIMARYAYQQHSALQQVEVHAVRIGQIVLVTNPFELFLNYGNQIKARSRARQTLIVQLACDSLGYLPTCRAEDGGHYSAYVSSGLVGHEGGDLLVRHTLDLIRQLFVTPDS
ncbi:MAG: hypothetical protein SCM11_02945 [Bacillota bacterium]|nr:hypothetical protein [Bacillota bacterium]